MIGIFDSGVGGLSSLVRLRELCPNTDICYFADTDNAPYGKKSESELIALVEKDIDVLLSKGASEVLIACCSASSVYDKLDEKYKKVAMPIIECTAEAVAKISPFGNIGIISTEATRRSGAFLRALEKSCPMARAFSGASSSLVSVVEGGARDGNISEHEMKIIKRELAPFESLGLDLMILGCTHFTHIRKTIEKILGVKTLSPAFVGAEAMARRINMKENGKTIFV